LATELAYRSEAASGGLTTGDCALYGWRVRSDVALEPIAEAPGPAEPDLVVSATTVGEVPTSRPEGTVLAEFPRGGDGTKMYWLVEDEQGFLLRMPGLVEYRISRDVRSVSWVRSPGTELEYAREVFRGHVMALLLGLAGYSVFHSSGVVLRDAHDPSQGRAVAILGGTAAGKSTVAGLLVAAGAKFLTDDLLCVDAASDAIVVRGGCAELRLRPKAARLSQLFAGVPTRRTLDERLAVTLGRGSLATQPLGLLVFPEISVSAERITASNLTPQETAIRLAGSPRMSGWLCRGVLERQFNCLAILADRVSAACIEVPSTDELGPELAGDLMAEVERALWGSSP
jgi:hypothetical protein